MQLSQDDNRGSVGTLARGLDILELFAGEISGPYSREEYEVALHSIAVPLAWMDSDGPVAVNVSLPSSRAARDATEELTRELRATAAAITGAAT